MGAADPGERSSSPLLNHIEAQTRDLNWTLANFAFVANVTTLAAECDVAHSPAMSVASCHAMPQLALAFIGDSADLLATYATFLADPGSEVALLVNEAQRELVEDAFSVVAVTPQWQMLFRGDPTALDPGPAAELVGNDLGAMQSLAKAERVPFLALAKDPFEQGPAFGVWEKRKLVAMGTTLVSVPGAAQIGNIVTRKDYKDRTCLDHVVAALVRSLAIRELSIFVVVAQEDAEAVARFERLGFERERPMYAMRCVLNV